MGTRALLALLLVGAAPFAAAQTGDGGGTGAPRPETVQEALVRAYETNPDLQAQRESVRAAHENIAQARAAYRPNVNAQGSTGIQGSQTFADGEEVQDSTTSPSSLSVILEQPLYQGGRVNAQLRQARFGVLAGRAQFTAQEQTVLLEAATAYFDVVRDQALVELRENNVRVLERQLQATRDRFEVGEVTRTDVSQAEARVSGAQANLVAAEGNLEQSRAVFEQVVGVQPGDLAAQDPIGNLPGSLDEAVEIALSQNPNIAGQRFNLSAAEAGIDVANAGFRPTFSLQGRLTESFDQAGPGTETRSASVTAQFQMPLYSGGATSSQVRQAKKQAGQRRLELDSVRRQVRSRTVQAWQRLQSARSAIEAREAQVRATEIALEGVRAEAAVGARTTLDVLNAEQENLNAQVDLVSAERDERIAAFQLLSAMGRLTSRELGLDVEYYDLESDYLRTRYQWYGTEVSE